MTDLLSQPLISTVPNGKLTLSGVMAALARDEVDSFPALRSHQAMFWHMFLVQLAALALHKAGRADLETTEAGWRALLRGLTPDFPDDEPWHLIVDDWTKPAFMQPPVPAGVELANDAQTADALDLLITSKNHDLKQAVASAGAAEDWLFALISLQTGEGYGGSGNQGIVRMNGGSSSRAMLALAPVAGNGKEWVVRPGAWFCRDVQTLLAKRQDVLEETRMDFNDDGLGLTWLAPWPEGEQLQTRDLDLWFIEVCRRVRLHMADGRIRARKGTSAATRINGKQYNGSVEDPWAPVHKSENKAFTLGDEGAFDYSRLVGLLFSGNWNLPLLARRSPFETKDSRVAIVAQALARGNSKTGGFRSRIVPIDSSGTRVSWSCSVQETLLQIAKAQTGAVDVFDKALSYALVLAAAGGERGNIKRETYALASEARSRLDQFADSIFFEHLWRRFDAEELGDEATAAANFNFAQLLWLKTQEIFERHLPMMPCPSLYRHRAEARARRMLRSRDIQDNYPELFAKKAEEKADG